MGIIFTMPLPQMLQAMTTSMATRATGQLAAQLFTAELESERPMEIMMGPVTMGGKKRMTFLTPKALKAAASTRYMSPAQATPKQAYGSISVLGTVRLPASSASMGATAA